MTYPIVTAHEALADGIHPGELFRAARYNELAGKPDIAARVRRVGRELARLMGMDLGGRKRAANDNRGRNDGRKQEVRKQDVRKGRRAA